ncbi:MAG: tRNA (N6-isopentenyl adenosine(37)-C2)-methylthiotransferase MiaB [Bacillota bacterium]
MSENTKKYYIITYGCQMNEHDSEKIAGMLEEIGYKKCNNIEKADLIFLNTCTVRENAEDKVFGKVGSLKQYKKKNPDLIIGIGGCMMQTESAANRIYKKHPHVDLIIGTHNIHKIPELIKNIEKEDHRVYEVWEEEQGLIPDVPSRREGDYKAWVSIIRGCNNFCSYCIVPYVRGRERSRSPQDIIKEVKSLIQKEVKEITLLGQNVNSYGKDLDLDIDFADLLQKIDKLDNIERIRYMTSHPRDFDQKLIETIKNSNNICEHFHLPVQSGSSRILKKMNRGYTRKQYINLIKNIRKAIPEASITTDIIVGFPGETKNDFQDTLNLVKEIQFDMAFTFNYSPREGTPAADLEEQVPEEIKNERLQKLMKIQNKISHEKNKELVGKNLEVLVEGESKNNPDTYSGRSRTNKLVIIPKNKDLKGKIVSVKINKVKSWTLYGQVINQKV